MEHYIKLEEKYYDRITQGVKNWELRKNDRDYQVGDTLYFEVGNSSLGTWIPQYKDKQYKILYVLQDVPGLGKGYCILSIEKVEE